MTSRRRCLVKHRSAFKKTILKKKLQDRIWLCVPLSLKRDSVRKKGLFLVDARGKVTGIETLNVQRYIMCLELLGKL